MDQEYKTLVNKALERFHFRLNTSGPTLNTQPMIH